MHALHVELRGRESGMSYKSDLKKMCRIFIGKNVIIVVIALIRLLCAACL